MDNKFMVAAALRALADRVASGFTTGFRVEWDGGSTLDCSQVVMPSEPVEFISFETVLEEGNEPRGQE